jgi:hypothetical protein
VDQLAAARQLGMNQDVGDQVGNEDGEKRTDNGDRQGQRGAARPQFVGSRRERQHHGQTGERHIDPFLQTIRALGRGGRRLGRLTAGAHAVQWMRPDRILARSSQDGAPAIGGPEQTGP